MPCYKSLHFKTFAKVGVGDFTNSNVDTGSTKHGREDKEKENHIFGNTPARSNNKSIIKRRFFIKCQICIQNEGARL